MKDKVQKIREEVARIQLYAQSEMLKQILDYIDEVQKEEPVSTKDKLLALSDGRLHLGWIDDAKVVEFEECLMQFHEDMNNIPQGTDSLTRLKDTDGVLLSYSKKLMSMAKEEPVSEDLEKAEKEWLTPQLDKSYANYGETKMMELTRFDGYAMLDAIEFGAKWQKKKTLKESEDAIQYVRENHSPSEVSDFQNAMNIAVMKAFDAGKEKMREQMMKNAVNGLVYAQRTNGEVMFRSNYVRKEGFEFGDKVKLIIIKEG